MNPIKEIIKKKFNIDEMEWQVDYNFYKNMVIGCIIFIILVVFFVIPWLSGMYDIIVKLVHF
jgi:antibiotic biosynthesis monooxygenase (ABM) superfamily enzyme